LAIQGNSWRQDNRFSGHLELSDTLLGPSIGRPQVRVML
jgi:hypothetical protein